MTGVYRLANLAIGNDTQLMLAAVDPLVIVTRRCEDIQWTGSRLVTALQTPVTKKISTLIEEYNPPTVTHT